jgi:catechol-2,3-dioxygenase
VAPWKLAHLVLRTRNLETMGRWYQNVLAARVAFEREGLAIGLTYDEEHHRIALVQIPQEIPDPAADIPDHFERIAAARQWTGMEHIAFTFASLRDLLSTYLRLKAEEIEPVFCVNHGGTMSLYYLDPDGNNVELQIDSVTMDQADEMMRSPGFHENAVGMVVDPDDLVARYEAGDPIADIVRADWLG